MLRDAEDVYTTIVTFKFRDTYGASEGYKTPEMEADAAKIDFEAMATNENMLLWQPSNVTFGSAQGFLSGSRDREYAFSNVFIVTGLRQYSDGGQYVGTLVDTLYSFREYEPGRFIFFNGDFSDIDFEPDKDAMYIIHAADQNLEGNGIVIKITPFYNHWAEAAGIDTQAIKPYYEITDMADLQKQEVQIYREIAEYYGAMNRALSVHRVHDLADIEEFHQHHVELLAGRIFTPEEAEAGEKLVVISQNIAKRQELEIGDELTILLPDSDTEAFYEWGLELPIEETYTIVGIVSYHEDYHKNIYIPSPKDDPTPVHYDMELGQATIKNGTADDFLDTMAPYLTDNIRVNIYDQGYETMANAVRVVQNAAIALSAVALLVVLAVLIFFSVQYADSQQETVEIMRSFGATKKESRHYLLSGSSLIVGMAIMLGIGVGVRYAEDLIVYALNFVADLQVIDTRYSDAFRGLVKPFNPVVTLSYGFAIAAGFAVLITALGLLLFFAERTVSGRLMTHRAKVRVPRAVKKSSTAFSGPLRQATLVARRDKARSLVIISLSVATLLFVSAMQATLTSYTTAKIDLIDNTELRGYTAKMDGHFTDRLAIFNTQTTKLRDTKGLGDIAYVYQTHYRYLGIVTHQDGTIGDAEEMPIIESGFQWENIHTALQFEPQIVFTDRVRQAPEFLFSDFEAKFMDSWDEEHLAKRDWDMLPAVISNDMKNEKGIEYGDIIRIYTQDHLYGANAHGIRPLEMQVVGSFDRRGDLDNIYAPLPLGALDPDHSTLNELPQIKRTLTTGHYLRSLLRTDHSLAEEELTQQQLLDIMLDNYYVSSLTFTVPDPGILTEIKDELSDKAFSGPGVQNRIRISVVVEDSQFLETISTLDQRSRYLELLYPVMLFLVILLGALTGFLAFKSRRENIALMRAMGAKKSTILATLFGEQTILLLFGAVIAIIYWLTVQGPEALSTWESYAFMLSYALSVILSTLYQNQKSALTIMTEKE